MEKPSHIRFGYGYPAKRRLRHLAASADDRVAGAQSIYRAIAVLRGVAQSNAPGITATALASKLDLTHGTTHRLLKTLAGEGLLTFDPYSKKYHLGSDLYLLGVEAHHFGRLGELLAGPMRRICDASRETVLTLVRSGNDALCLKRLDGIFPPRSLTLTVGARRPLGIGAGGMALLAAETDEVIERVLRHNQKTYSAYADFTAAEIRAEVERTRESGFSFNDGRLQDGVLAVGLATSPEGDVPRAAVSIAMNRTRISKRQRSDLEALLESEIGSIDWKSLDAVVDR